MAIIDFVRHAQGFHNLSFENLSMPDPLLTPLGESQCADLASKYPHHDKVRLLVASPLRRTLRTCLDSFAPVAARGIKVIAVPELQEVSALPSDVGSEPAVLAREFDGSVDLSRVQPGWNHKGKGSPYEPEVGKLEKRARAVRRLLRELTAGLAEDDRVAVVTHGGFLHFITEDYSGIPPLRATGWENTECRSYVFADPTGADENASITEKPEAWQDQRIAAKGLTDAEQRELRAVHYTKMSREIAKVVEEGRVVQFDVDYGVATEQGANATVTQHA